MTSCWLHAVTRLLLCGLSGAGKTTIGEQLAEAGWVHFDCEQQQPLEEFVVDPLAYIPAGDNVVASWGFVPEFANSVKVLERAGFLPVWLWGEKHHLDNALRDRGEEQEFIDDPIRNEQRAGLFLISPHMVLNTFRFDGSRWDVAGLIHDVYWVGHA
jgi:hypothetical protein